jgi:hypothetical protein
MSRSLDGALRELRRGVDAVPDTENERARRERIGGSVTQLQRALVRRDRSRRRLGGALLAAAALVALAVTLMHDAEEPTIAMAPDAVRVNVVGGRVSVRDGDTVTSIAGGDIAVARDTVIAAEGSAAVLRLQSSAALELTRASRVRLSASPAPGGRRERVRLLAGRVDLDVPKLASGAALAVETPDAVVEVRGTRFAVSLVERAPLAPFTRVDVSEGRVRIQLDDGVREVGAGETWRSSDADPPLAEPAPKAQVEPEVAAPPAPNSAEPRKNEPAPRRGAGTPSDLAAQNRQLEAAELARKSRMPELALERFARLIELYPDSDLAQNARVARFRLLDAMGRREEAARAARSYLAQHPRGFAAGEARSLLEREGTSLP